MGVMMNILCTVFVTVFGNTLTVCGLIAKTSQTVTCVRFVSRVTSTNTVLFRFKQESVMIYVSCFNNESW
jgi:hypothetical protein